MAEEHVPIDQLHAAAEALVLTAPASAASRS